MGDREGFESTAAALYLAILGSPSWRICQGSQAPLGAFARPPVDRETII
jgi:hypothetical protein